MTTSSDADPPKLLRATERDLVQVHAGRVAAFRDLAARTAGGEVLTPPALLTGEARRRYVRATIREDHVARIRQRPDGAEAKFATLAGSAFDFFRGSALLFYRDMAGQDAGQPTVLALGDPHPGNFGVMPDADNRPIFGVNDFDEVWYAPFTWDLKRAATGFLLGAADVGGQGAKVQRRAAKSLIEGYSGAMRRYAVGAAERHDAFRPDNSPKIVRALFDAGAESRADWLKRSYLDDAGRGFRRRKGKLTPLPKARATFQPHIDALVASMDGPPPTRAGRMRVKDVAERHDQGAASLGLARYYVLIEGPGRDGTDDLIVEFKQARRSALEGLVPPNGYDAGDAGERIAHGQAAHLARGDVFFGAVEIDGVSFMTRERSPFRRSVDLEELSPKGWRAYAEVCGRALAQAHARSDDYGLIDHDVDSLILHAMRPEALFVDQILAFADEAAARLRQDHAYFCKDRALGAFGAAEMVYP